MKNVIILAAGEGTRLRPFTLDRPKCLVEVEGKSLLDRQLEVLESAKLDQIVIVGGYKGDKLKGKGAKLKSNPRFSETNMVCTLFCAEDELMEGAIVAYGDIVYSKEVLMQLLDSKADIAVAVDLDWESYWRARNEDPLSDAETLKMDGDGRILELGGTPTSIKEIEGQYMGLMKFTETGAQALQDIYRDACQV